MNFYIYITVGLIFASLIFQMFYTWILSKRFCQNSETRLVSFLTVSQEDAKLEYRLTDILKKVSCCDVECAEVIVVDMGMSDAQRHMCDIFSANYPNLYICKKDNLPELVEEYIKKSD